MIIRPIARGAEDAAPEGEAAWCARLMSATEPWVTLGRTYQQSLETLRDPAKETWVAEVDGAPAGFLILDMRGAFVGYIQTICVAPELRRRGLGSEMVAWAERRIFEVSPNVFLCVSSFNPGARRLYERLGYQVVGELTDYIVAGHSEILMRKTLGPWSGYRRT